MGTRATIAMRLPDGRYRACGLTTDGDPDRAGRTLRERFDSDEAAAAIVALGELSVLDRRVRIEPVGTHSYDRKEPGTIVAFHRDRGEDLEIQEHESYTDLQDASETYLYLREDGAWTIH